MFYIHNHNFLPTKRHFFSNEAIRKLKDMSSTNGISHDHGDDEGFKFFVDGDKEEFDPEKWTGLDNQLPRRGKNTGVNVLIVGAGLAGLTCALECWRKGHNVVGILERNKGPNYSGEFLMRELNLIDF